MLLKPKLAMCSDRTVLPKTNAKSGQPEDWFNNKNLAKYALSVTSFDFFIDWTIDRVEDPLWIKRIVSEKFAPWPIADTNTLQGWIECSEYLTSIKRLCAFSSSRGFTVSFMLFKESENWGNSKSPIVKVKLDEDGNIHSTFIKTLEEVRGSIRKYSGGPISIGQKGLIFGTSSLECFLSKTDSAWPGDVDSLILNDSAEPIAILEYKKHTKTGSIENQTLSNYYPYPDGRKYKRLWLFKERISEPALPLVVCYYSTDVNEKQIKLERLGGTKDKLFVKENKLIPAPDKDLIETIDNVIFETLEFI